MGKHYQIYSLENFEVDNLTEEFAEHFAKLFAEDMDKYRLFSMSKAKTDKLKNDIKKCLKKYLIFA